MSKKLGINNNYLEAIYYLLWLTQDNQFENGLGFSIPNSLFLKYGMPTAWYFTGKHGKILRKSDKAFTIENILKAMSTNTDKFEICSVLYILYERSEKVEIKYLGYQDLLSAFD